MKRLKNINLENEKLFENKKTLEPETRKAQSKFYWATHDFIKSHNAKTCSQIRKMDVLEIGCSTGENARLYLKYCENYTGIDISDEAIKKAKKLIKGNTKFLCSDAHKLPFSDASYDCVIVNSLLHHMDLHTVLPEINRVLKEEGRMIIREPLDINPIFKIYRLATPGARTVDEKPFDFYDLKLLETYFNAEYVEWNGFTNLMSAFVRINILRKFLSGIDHLIAKTPIKFLFWQIGGIYRKKNVQL